MEKIKRLTTILAISGCIGVMVIYLYIPLRDIWRESAREEVSLAQGGAVAGEAEGSGKESIPLQEETLKAAPVNSRDVEIRLRTKDRSAEIALWREEGENTGYFFLPSHAGREDCEISISGYQADGYLLIGGERLKVGDILKDIVWEQVYPLQIYDKNDRLLVETSVVFYRIDNLPAVFIDTRSGSMDLIHEDINYEERGQAQIFNVDGEVLYRGDLEKISGRGNSTWPLDKKPYEIKLAERTDLFGFGKAGSWNLLANGFDDTQYRNALILSMGENAGLAYTPQGTLVSLYCNGEYAGNYYFCEKVQIGEGRVEIRDLEEEILSVYQQTDLEKLERMESEDGTLKWIDIKYDPEDISGGYLIEREIPERYHKDALCGFQTAQGDCYSIISPKHASYRQVSYIAGLVQELHDAAEAEDGINPLTGKHYTEYMDMDSFVKKYLLEEISKNYDGGVTSSYFYKPADSESTKIFAGPAWDYDVAFGNCGLDYFNSNPMGVTMLADHVLGTDLFRQLYRQSDFKDAVAACYRAEYRPLLEQMPGQIGEYDRIYGQSVYYNNIRWKSMYNRYRYYDTYEDNIRYLKYFIEQRMQFLDEVWIQNEIYHCISFYVDDHIWERIYAKDGETPELELLPARNNSIFIRFTREQTGGMAFDESRPVYSDMDFYAQWEELPVD